MSEAPDAKIRILEAARELIRKSDGAELRAREVARSAGVNAAMINYHFKSRDGLIQACLESYYTDIRKMIGEHLPMFARGEREQAYANVLGDVLGYVRANRPLARMVLLDFVKEGRPRGEPMATEEPYVGAMVAGLTAHLGIGEVELRFRLRSLVLLIGRYAVFADDELLRLAKTESLDEAWEKLGEHLIGLAKVWLTPQTQP